MKRWEITRGAVIEDYGKVRSYFITLFGVVEFVISVGVALVYIAYAFGAVTGRYEVLECTLQCLSQEDARNLCGVFVAGEF